MGQMLQRLQPRKLSTGMQSMKFFTGIQDFLSLTFHAEQPNGFFDVAGPSTAPPRHLPRQRTSSDSRSPDGPPPTPSHRPTSLPRSLSSPTAAADAADADDLLLLVRAAAEPPVDERRRPTRAKTVRFVDADNPVSGYLEPPRPHFDHPSAPAATSPAEIRQRYVRACRHMRVQPSAKLENQILTYHCVATERQDTISLKGEKMNYAHVECLEEIFKRVQFETVDLEYCFLDDECVVALSDMLEYYHSARRLNLSFNQHIGLRGWHSLFKMIRNSDCVAELNVRYTSLSERCMPVLARCLRCEPTLTTLRLEDTSIAGRSLLLLVCALKVNGVLRELYLGDNGLGPNDGAHLYQLIAGSPSLQLLDLRNNHLQDAGVKHLCDALAEPETWKCGALTTLVLWNNRITGAGCQPLNDTLCENRRLETLNLGCNAIGSAGVDQFKDALTRNRTLLRLGLQAAKLNCQAAIALAESIADNPTLLRLDLRDNPDVKSAGLLALHLAMKLNTGIVNLNLDRSCCTAGTNKVKEYSDRFKLYFDEIMAFCERNRQRALEHEKLAAESTAGDTVDAPIVHASARAILPRPVQLARRVAESEGERVEMRMRAETRMSRSESLTCSDTVDDVAARVLALKLDSPVAAPPVDDEPDEQQPPPPAAPPSPRFDVRPTTTVRAEPSAPVDAAVRAVVVNLCAYEAGDSALLTPSVPRSRRQLMADFERRLHDQPAVRAPERAEEGALQGASVDEDVAAVVRHLVTGCIKLERDALRRSVQNKRNKLSGKAPEMG